MNEAIDTTKHQEYIDSAKKNFARVWEVPVARIKIVRGHLAKNHPLLKPKKKESATWFAHEHLPNGQAVTFYVHGQTSSS